MRSIDASAAVREAMGPDFGIGVDFHGRVHRPMAKVLAKELDPVQADVHRRAGAQRTCEALREIVNHTATPIALGERLFSRWDFKQILTDGLVDIIQPDPSHAGGITETPQDRGDGGSLRRGAGACIARWVRSRWRPACSWMRSATMP